jgi:choline dehydrogenase
MKSNAHPICDNYLAGCAELGFPINEDFNGENFEGAGIYETNIKKGFRSSSAAEYLKPALSRPNLTVRVNTVTERIILQEVNGMLRATGVVILQDGLRHELTAAKEVILAAGAVGSPTLLQLSGIGDRELLAKHDIETIKHLPAVGKNLQDHLCVSFYYRANRKTLNDELGPLWGQAKSALRYLFTREGPLAQSVNEAGGFLKGCKESDIPNLQMYFNPLSYTIPKDPNASLKPEPYSGFLVCFNPCRPTSRGQIEIASKDPAAAPKIMPNYLSTQKDLEEAVQGSVLIRQLMQTKALKEITIEEVIPAKTVTDEASMLAFFREQSGSIYHLCGTCAMGPDEANSVVSPRLTVHGLEGLRVIDASIFPNITSGNTNAPTMMVAEKGSDLILADWA